MFFLFLLHWLLIILGYVFVALGLLVWIITVLIAILQKILTKKSFFHYTRPGVLLFLAGGVLVIIGYLISLIFFGSITPEF